jgi:hypothetical protein
MRLTLDARISPGTKIQVQICVPGCEVDILTFGEVRWVQPRDEVRWSIGCALGEALSDELLDKLATHNVLDRRYDERKHVCHPGQAKWELSVEPSDVTIMNYSASGCCLLFAEEVTNPSDRLLLHMLGRNQTSETPLEARIPLRAMWHQQTEEGCAVGCAFLSRTGYLTMRELLEDGKPTGPLHGGRELVGNLVGHRLATRWRWIAVAAFVLLAVKGIDLLRTRTKGELPARVDVAAPRQANTIQSAGTGFKDPPAKALRNVLSKSRSQESAR